MSDSDHHTYYEATELTVSALTGLSADSITAYGPHDVANGDPFVVQFVGPAEGGAPPRSELIHVGTGHESLRDIAFAAVRTVGDSSASATLPFPPESVIVYGLAGRVEIPDTGETETA